MIPVPTYAADDPRTPSASYGAQADAYRLIEAAMGGAAHVRGMREAFLPKYPAETQAEYARRVASAPWRPEFVDCLRNISAKPFSKPVSLQGTVPEAIKTFAEDVDTLGNNLHVFAAHTFWMGVAFGLQGILVEYPKVRPDLNRRQEQAAGARPYWMQVPAQSLLALRTRMVAGKTVVTHARIRLVDERSEGRFGTKSVDQVKVFNLDIPDESDAEAPEATKPTWELWEATDDGRRMVLVDEGRLALPRIPLALFYTGSRLACGSHVRPPLTDLADMQMELYRALSREDEALTFTGSPMLKGKGLSPPTDGSVIEIGPRRILYAPSNGTGDTDWDFLAPPAENLAHLRAHIQSVVDDMRRLGLQPLLPRSGDVTATVGALEAAKAHSAVEAWANALQDALEQSLVFTAEWMGEKPTAEVSVHTDFGVDLDGGADMDSLSKMQMAGQITKRTLWEELMRRGKLGPAFDPDQEADDLDAEMPDVPVLTPATHPIDPRLPLDEQRQVPPFNGAGGQQAAA